jgi:hypothetical protein
MTEETTIEQVEDYDINEIQAALTASKVLVAILETLGQVRVLTKTVFEATNKSKELIVDYDEEGPAFIFRLPTEADMSYTDEAIVDEPAE